MESCPKGTTHSKTYVCYDHLSHVYSHQCNNSRDIRISSNPELLQKEVAKNVNIQFDLQQKEPTYTSSLSQTMLLPLQAGDVNEWCSAVEAEIRDLGIK